LKDIKQHLIRYIGEPEYVSVKYFFADHDEIVSPHSVAIADAHKTNSTHILTDCGHHYFTDEAKKKIKDVLLTSCT